MRKSVLVAVLALIPVSFAHAQIPTAERDALIALYNATDGANWTDNTNWLGAVGTECTWYGVTCSGGHVQWLILQTNQLSGSIPPELGSLSSLEWLNLRTNQLSGSIPPELGSLSSLTVLILSSNQLSGSIPAELGTLSNVRSLGLSSNQLSGSIPPELGSLSSLTSLLLYSNQLSGNIPPELGGLSSLVTLGLYNNRLSGSVPPELGTLSSLLWLQLESNQLSGSIPPELGSLSSLQQVYLGCNQLSGSIPPELGSLSSLRYLYLDHNQLTGVIPPQLGNLASLDGLLLNSNKLSGVIPAELQNLPLEDVNGLDLRWNALHSDNASLIAFLNGKGGDWQSTQTIAPVNLAVDSVGNHTVWLSWDAVSYQSDRGGYEVFSAPTGSGVWTSGGWTESKTETTFPVTGLVQGTTYDFAVLTYTDPHANNQNLVISDPSLKAMATTAAVGCAQPTIEIAWGDPITLSEPGSYDSYLWSTGEVTSSIVVAPPFEQWYWVTVTSTGPCEETAATSVDPTSSIFADGFESGDTSEWSTTGADEPLWISGNSPTEGGLGDLVIIYGSGFEDPLQVFLGGVQMEVVSVSSTELVVRIPDDLGTSCSAIISGAFKVVLLASNQEATGGSFTVRGNTPTVLLVSPIIIAEGDLGTPNADITITGKHFSDVILVTVASYVMPTSQVDRVSDTTIDVANLPGIDTLGVVFSTTQCILPGGEPGEQSSSTSVPVSVSNFPGDCTDTLNGAIVIEPTASVCTASPANIVTNPTGTWNFPATTAGACSPPQILTITNTGGEDATGLNIGLPLANFNYISDDCPPNLGWDQSCNLTMEFCPATAGAKIDQLLINYTSAMEGVKAEVIALNGNGI